MKAIFIVLVTLAVPLVLCYDEKFAMVDLDKIIGDETLFNGYIDCLLDKGPCNLEHSEEYKQLLPDLVATACANCTPIQIQHLRKTLKALGEKNIEEFMEFKRKYDPTGKYEAPLRSVLL